MAELFNEFESVLVNATEATRHVLVIGFLEDIHNLTVRFHKPAEQIDPDVLLGYFGPKSRSEWFSLVRQYLDWARRGRVGPTMSSYAPIDAERRDVTPEPPKGR